MSEENNNQSPGSNADKQNLSSESTPTPPETRQVQSAPIGGEPSSRSSSGVVNKPEKKKGPIRWEGIIPFTIILLLIDLYTTLFLDLHLKKGLEWAGFESLGAEVNIENLKTSFWKASLQIDGIELTNPDKPTHNMLYLGQIRFAMSWDALLRAKILIEEMVTEGIAFDTKRKKPGRVKPPKPPKEGPSLLDEALADVQKRSLNQLAKQNEGKLGADVAKLLSGEADTDQILASIRSSLQTEAYIANTQKLLDEQKNKWDNKLKSLPGQKELDAIKSRVTGIRPEEIKTPEQAQKAVAELQSALKELESHLKTYQDTKSEFDKDLKGLQKQIQGLPKQIQSDLAQLQSYLKAPQLDFKSILSAMMQDQIRPYLAKVAYWRGVAQQYMDDYDDYLPPKLRERGSKEDEPPLIKPHPRQEGVTYEFGKVGGYPLFWIKKISVSSVANAKLGLGNMKGQILDISSQQRITGKPTRLLFEGDFPSLEWQGLRFRGEFDARSKLKKINYNLSLADFPVGKQILIDSDQVRIHMLPSRGSFLAQGELVGFKQIQLLFKKSIPQVTYDIESSNSEAKEFLNQVFTAVPSFSFDASIRGELPRVSLSFDSDWFRKLGESFSIAFKQKLEQVKARLEGEIRKALEQEKQKMEKQIATYQAQLQGEIQKAQAQIEQEKARLQAEQKRVEEQIRNQINAQVEQEKKKLEQEAKKKAEELKKKLGF